MTPTTCCICCGHRPSVDRPIVLWSMSVREGRRGYTCSPCVRSALPGIETGVQAGLDDVPQRVA
jgi:hypothetical protein